MQPLSIPLRMRNIQPLLYSALLLAGLYLYLLYSLGGRMALGSMLATHVPQFMAAVVLGAAAIWIMYFKLITRVAWRFYPGLRFSLSLLLLWALGIGLVYGFSLLLEPVLLGTGLYGENNLETFLITGAIVTLIISLLFTLSDFSWHAYYRFAADTLASLRTARRQKELQFDVLRAQLTPHYLFNSLNTASNLISYNSAGAEEYLRRLAHNIQYLLAQPAEASSSLQQELAVVDSFFHLMQVRFGNRIQLQKQINEKCLQKKVPTMALQLLVENAIKHNVASSEMPVHIIIAANSEGIEVQNNITRSPQELKSGKVGLHNLQERYHYLSDQQLRVEQTTDSFCVHLPYLNEKKKEAYVQ